MSSHHRAPTIIASSLRCTIISFSSWCLRWSILDTIFISILDARIRIHPKVLILFIWDGDPPTLALLRSITHQRHKMDINKKTMMHVVRNSGCSMGCNDSTMIRRKHKITHKLTISFILPISLVTSLSCYSFWSNHNRHHNNSYSSISIKQKYK